MPDELKNAFVTQLITNLDGISEALRILQQHYQVNVQDQKEETAERRFEGDEEYDRVLEVLKKKSAEGKAEKIREILSLFRAEKFSEVEKKHYGQLLEMVNAL